MVFRKKYLGLTYVAVDNLDFKCSVAKVCTLLEYLAHSLQTPAVPRIFSFWKIRRCNFRNSVALDYIISYI